MYQNDWISLQYPPKPASRALKFCSLSMVLIFIGSSIAPDFFYAGALNATALHGQWWRFITSMDLHGSFLHILFNVAALWSLGCLAEQYFRWYDWLIAFFLGGFVGGFITLFLCLTRN